MSRMTIEDIGDAALTARTSPLLLEGRAPQREARQPKPALHPKARDLANRQLKGYSFTVGEDGFFYNSDNKRSMIELRYKKGRFEAWGGDSKQWSGPDVGWFVERFWFDKKKAETKREDLQAEASDPVKLTPIEDKNFRIHTGPVNVKGIATALRKAGVKVTFEGTEHVYIKWPIGKVERMDLGRIVNRLKSAHGTSYGIRVQDIKPWPRSPADGD